MDPVVTRAMVLAAGEGTRLRPLTLTTPKAMLPIGGKPLIGHTLSWLKRHGIAEAGINLHYLGQQIVDYVGDGRAFGLKVIYSWEDTLLGTAGGTKRLEPLFGGERFAVVYADMLTDLNLTRMAEHHLEAAAAATIALFVAPRPHEVGIVELDSRDRIVGFVEKPPPGTEKGNLANGGVYILEPEVLRRIPASRYADFGFDVFPSMLRDRLPMLGYRPGAGEYLFDIGDLDKYRQANADYAAGRVRP